MRIQIDQKKVRQFMLRQALPELVKSGFKPPMPISQLKKGIPEMLQVLAMRPDIAKAMMPLQKALYLGKGQVERVLKEKIFLKVSKMNQCQFCTVAHSKALASFNQEEAPSDEREKVALEYAEQVTRDANAVSDELFARLKRHFSDGQLIELTLNIGLINLLNKFNDALQIRFR